MSTTFKTNSSSAKLLNKKSQNDQKHEEENDENEKLLEKLQKVQMVSCLTKKCNILKQKIYNCRSKFSLPSSFLIVCIIYLALFSLTMMIIHIYLFDKIFKFDFYMAIKEEYLDKLLTNVDDLNTDLSKIEIQTKFEEIKSLYLLGRLFGEQVYGGLLDDLSKKYPNISPQSETLNKNLENVFSTKDINTIYTIPKESAYNFIDNRNDDSLAELAKIYYIYFPFLSQSAFTKDIYYNQSYLIAYEIDTNKNIKGDILYFNYPRSGDEEFSKDNIFTPGNSFISPKINETCYNLLEDNKNFSNENWFIDADCNFRNLCSDLYNLNIFYSHLNYLRNGQIKKSIILTMQIYLSNKNNDKHFIVNIIFYVAQKNIKYTTYDYSVFILNSDPNIIKKKYSDDKSFIISRNDITEIGLTEFDNQYFQYGLKNINNFFYEEGVSFADYDIGKFYEPSIYYTTTDELSFDIRYLSAIFLYSELFKLTEHKYIYDEDEEMQELIINDTKNIFNVCNNFNFFVYNEHIIDNGIDCWDEQNLVYFNNNHNIENVYDEYNSYPYCVCIPLYCNKNNNKNLKNVTIVDKITLPNKCQNNFKHYTNNNVGNSFFKITQKKITNYLKEDYDGKLENDYLKFVKSDFTIYTYLKIMIIFLIDNTAIKNTLNFFFAGFSKLQRIFEVIMSIGVILAFLFSTIIIIIHVKKISKIIYDYKEKFENNLINFGELMRNSNNNKTNNKNNNKNYAIVSNDSFEKNEDEIYENQNELLDYLFNVYSKFNNLSENQISGIFKENKSKQKIEIKSDLLKENNELFCLLYIFCLFAPRVTINIKMNHNFYGNAKLNQNYLKSISKSTTKISKEKITLSQGIIFELLSTNIIHDFGLLPNLNFNYITNMSKNINNEIQNFLIENTEQEEYITDKKNIKIVCKGKNPIMSELENNFQSDDYLKLKDLNSAFDNFIINTCYKYLEIINKESIHKLNLECK